jgi:hypothetical protein
LDIERIVRNTMQPCDEVVSTMAAALQTDIDRARDGP